MATKFPTVRIENPGAAQSNAPFTFGQMFMPGGFHSTDSLFGQIKENTSIPLQVDAKTSHSDGSVRYAVISGVIPSISAGEVLLLSMYARPGVSLNPINVIKKGPIPSIGVTIGGVTYAADMSDSDGFVWIDGPIAHEYHVTKPIVSSIGPHPHLIARFGLRSYGHAARVEIVIENNKTFAAGAQNFVYDITLNAGSGAKTLSAMTHFHHARWRHVEWIGCQPLIVHPDTDYLLRTKAVPHYDQSVKPDETDLALMMRNIAHPHAGVLGGVGPLKIGPVQPAMGSTGGRPDIAPLPEWSVAYLLTHDIRAYQVMIAAAEGSGTWPIHYRDENTTYPVRIDNDVNKNISTHMNMSNKGPLPVPRFVAGKATVPITPDAAHQPGLTYLPYLLTGDYYYLEELQFWAAWNNLETAAGNRGYDKGLLNWHQVRGQAWCLRTLGQAAYITPDAHPLKTYLLKQLDNNLNFYHQTFVVGNPNELGIYDGSGAGSFQLADGVAPFQDSYLTWAFGYLVELGFEKALPILQWKSKFLKGCLLDPEYDPIAGMDYWLKVRDNGYIPAVPALPYRAAVAYQPAVAATSTTPGKPEVKAMPEQLAKPATPAIPASPIYKTFGEVYRKNFGGPVIKDDNRNPRTHPAGTLFIDQPRGSQAQADWLKAAFKYNWVPGQWFGYASYEMGYAANAQPALAVIVDLAEGKEAWEVFDKRTVKPDYRKGAQFNIIPRPVVIAPPVVVDPQPPVEPPVVTPPAPKLNARTRLEIAIQAHSEASEADRYVLATDAITTLGEVLASERAIVQAGKK